MKKKWKILLIIGIAAAVIIVMVAGGVLWMVKPIYALDKASEYWVDQILKYEKDQRDSEGALKLYLAVVKGLEQRRFRKDLEADLDYANALLGTGSVYLHGLADYDQAVEWYIKAYRIYLYHDYLYDPEDEFHSVLDKMQLSESIKIRLTAERIMAERCLKDIRYAYESKGYDQPFDDWLAQQLAE